MADPARLLEEEREGWRRFVSTLEAVDRERREVPATPEDWSAKDVAFHVAWWLEDCRRALEAIGAGTWDPSAEPADASAVDAVNAEHAARAAPMAWDAVLGFLRAARERARAAFARLPEVGADAWSWFEESGPLHYEEHLPQLDALRGAGGTPG